MPSVVIVEDEPLVAFDMEWILQDAGFEVVKVLHSCVDAHDWIKANSFDVAVLDVKLRDGDCTEIARMLHARKTPFVVYSGSSDLQGQDQIFATGKWVRKPSLPSDLSNAVSAALDTRVPSEGRTFL